MKTIIYDKADWQIEGGVRSSEVLKHFKMIMNWSEKNHLLSDEGLEILSFGIDDSISLHSRMFTKRGNAFMEKFYDKYISSTEVQESMNDDLKSIALCQYLN